MSVTIQRKEDKNYYIDNIESPSFRLTFVAGGDLRVNRGGENILFNLLKYKPNDISITIVETDYRGISPLILSEKALREKIGNAKIIHIKSPIKNEKVKQKNFKIEAFMRIFINDLLLLLRIKFSYPKEIIKHIRNTDVVYLIYNRFSLFFNNDIPIIASEHGFVLWKHPILWKIYLIYNRNINGFHAFPKDEEILNKYKFKYKMVLPNGVDTELFYPDLEKIQLDYGNSTPKLKILFNAILAPSKGLDILIPVINSLNNDNIEFHIAGGGPMANEIKNNKKIIFHEKPDDDALAKLYRECDVFVYPTHADTFGLVVLQALSSGLYVLCSDYLKGIFDNFENKYLEYLPLDIDKFKDRIIEITQDRSLIKHDKEKEYNYVKDNYNWSVISKKFYDYMRKFYNESKNSD